MAAVYDSVCVSALWLLLWGNVAHGLQIAYLRWTLQGNGLYFFAGAATVGSVQVANLASSDRVELRLARRAPVTDVYGSRGG